MGTPKSKALSLPSPPKIGLETNFFQLVDPDRPGDGGERLEQLPSRRRSGVGLLTQLVVVCAFQLNGVCVSPTGGGGRAAGARRVGSERSDAMRRSRSQGTRARLVRAFTTAGASSSVEFPTTTSTNTTTTPDDTAPCSPPPSPFSATRGAGGGCGGSESGGGWVTATTRVEQRATPQSLLFARHNFASFGSNVTYTLVSFRCADAFKLP